MRVVNGFVVAFLPIGHLVYAASPLVDAALYQCECQSDKFDWDRCEVFTEDNAVPIPIREPNYIDGLLDDRVLIRMSRGPAEIWVRDK